MIGLTYISMATQPITPEILSHILTQSRQYNRSHRITGLLLYRDIFFIQYIEGESQAVEELYDSILRDPRHTNVTLLYREEIEQRMFPNWWMGMRDIGDWLDSYDMLFSIRTLRDLLDKGSRSRAIMTMRAFMSDQGARSLLEDFGTAIN